MSSAVSRRDLDGQIGLLYRDAADTADHVAGVDQEPELPGRTLGDFVQALRYHREIGELSEVARAVGLRHGALRVGGVFAEDLRPGDPNDKLGGHGQPHVVWVIVEIGDVFVRSRRTIRAGRRTPGLPASAPPALPCAPAALT